VLFVTIAKVGTPVMMLENSIATTQRTPWISKAMLYLREISTLFFRVCGYNKLNTFKEGNLVFADVAGSVKNLNPHLHYNNNNLAIMAR